MTEYITKEQAELIVESALREYIRTGAVETAFEKLYSLPDADVAPVVHARWEWITENLYKCSHCHAKTLVDEFLNETLYMYCPYCGARMDGGN